MKGFDEPQIRPLMADEKFDATLNTSESEAWLASKNVANSFKGNHSNYKNIVAILLNKYQKMEYNMV